MWRKHWIDTSWKPKSCCGSAVYILLPAQPSCTSMGQVWLMTHTCLAWWLFPRSDASWMSEQQTYPGQVNVYSCTCLQLGITREGKSASLTSACCCLPLTPRSSQAPGMQWPQQQQPAPRECSLSLPCFQQKRSILANALWGAEMGCCRPLRKAAAAAALGEVGSLREQPQSWHAAAEIELSLNYPVMAEPGVCRSKTRQIYWQGWLCCCKGCAQAVAG